MEEFFFFFNFRHTPQSTQSFIDLLQFDPFTREATRSSGNHQDSDRNLIAMSDADDSTTDLKNETIAVATISIVLYGSLLVVALFYYYKFVNHEKDDVRAAYTNIGKYDHAKKLFFGLLAISTALEIPNYLDCLARGGAVDCEWKGADHLIFWFFHLFALCGYAYCVIIPCVLWSDMINKKDGRLFFSVFVYDGIKRYFQVLLLLYLINSMIYMLLSLAYYDRSDSGRYFRDAPMYQVLALSESILIILISIGCLYCGIQLERHVHLRKFATLTPEVEKRFLFILNVILGIIVISFCVRGALVFRFAPGLPKSYREHISYGLHTLLARWIPTVLCQSLLILIMKSSGKEVVTRNSNLSFPSLGPNQEHSFNYKHVPSNDSDDLEASLLAVYNVLGAPNRSFDARSTLSSKDGDGNSRPIPVELRSILGDWIEDVTVRLSDVSRSDGSFAVVGGMEPRVSYPESRLGSGDSYPETILQNHAL